MSKPTQRILGHRPGSVNVFNLLIFCLGCLVFAATVLVILFTKK